ISHVSAEAQVFVILYIFWFYVPINQCSSSFIFKYIMKNNRQAPYRFANLMPYMLRGLRRTLGEVITGQVAQLRIPFKDIGAATHEATFDKSLLGHISRWGTPDVVYRTAIG